MGANLYKHVFCGGLVTAMTGADVESLLSPVSAERPCGVNVEYERSYLDLLELSRGKPEQEVGSIVRPAEKAPWSLVRESAERLFKLTKDLQISGIWYRAMLNTEGLRGVEAGLAVTRGLLERYWENVFPLLDAEDDNDPTHRMNVLLTSLVGDESMAALRVTPLVESKRFGRPSLRSHRIASGVLKVGSEAAQASDLAQERAKIDGAFAEVRMEDLSERAASVQAALDHLGAIGRVLTGKAGAAEDALQPLSTDLKEIQGLLNTHLEKRGGTPIGNTANGEDASEDEESNRTGTPVLSGDIRTRSEVKAAMARICEYYARSEPSSPVPLLLQRASRLVDKDFMAIVRDLTPAGVGEAELIVGLAKDER